MVYNKYRLGRMETIAISKFKATCLSVLQKVKRTGRPVLVTRVGKPIASIVPPPTPGLFSSGIGGQRALALADQLLGGLAAGRARKSASGHRSGRMAGEGLR